MKSIRSICFHFLVIFGCSPPFSLYIDFCVVTRFNSLKINKLQIQNMYVVLHGAHVWMSNNNLSLMNSYCSNPNSFLIQLSVVLLIWYWYSKSNIKALFWFLNVTLEIVSCKFTTTSHIMNIWLDNVVYIVWILA